MVCDSKLGREQVAMSLPQRETLGCYGDGVTNLLPCSWHTNEIPVILKRSIFSEQDMDYNIKDVPK